MTEQTPMEENSDATVVGDGEGAVPAGEHEGEGAGLGPPPDPKVLEGLDREPAPNTTPTSSDVGYQTLTKADIREGADPEQRDIPAAGETDDD